MNAKELVFLICIFINIILMSIAITTFIKKRSQGKLSKGAFGLKIIVAVLVPIAGFISSKISLKGVSFTQKNSGPQ